jgi:hypothetical protein
MNERICDLLRKVKYYRAESPADRRVIYQLRYDCYLREPSIATRPDEMLLDKFDAHPNTIVFGLRIEDQLGASIRVHVLTEEWRDSPTMYAFGDVLQPLIDAGQILIDATRFVVDSAVARRYPKLAYLALRLPFLAAARFRAEAVLVAVRAEHASFYRRVLRHSEICQPREYPQLTRPLRLMIGNYPRQHANILNQYPFFAPRLGELDHLFGCRDSALERHRVIAVSERLSVSPRYLVES